MSAPSPAPSPVSTPMHMRPGAGYSLLEMLAVVAILAVAAVVALPSAQPLAEVRADAAAGEVARALRHARDNAQRTGAPRAFDCLVQANAVRVTAIDTTGPAATIAANPLDHPATRAPYALALDSVPAGNNMALVSCTFLFADNTLATALAFDSSGNPVRGVGSAAARVQALRSGAVVLGAGNVVRTIAVDASGRITIS